MNNFAAPINNKDMNEKFRDNFSKIMFIAVAIIIGACMFSLCLDSGCSIAENEYQISQGVQLDRYYKSLGDDKSILDSPHPIYSGWFNALSVSLSEIFGGCELRNVRHATNSVFAFIGIILCGLLAKRCSNWRSGVFAMIMLASYPVFFGHANFNIEDIPVATCFVASIYFTKRLFDYFPKPKIYDIALLSLSMGLCIAANPNCMFIYALLLIVCIAILVSHRKDEGIKKAAIWYSASTIIAMLVSHLIVYALTPAMQNLCDISALQASTTPNSPLRLLYDGQLYWSDLLPWHYNTKMLAISLPIYIFIGVALALGLAFARKKNRAETILFLCLAIFPILIYSLKGDTNGIWQHLLYSQIPLILMAAIGYDLLADMAKSKAAISLLPIILALMPIIHIIRTHPYEHIYYNEFVGGVEGAFGNYEIENYGLTYKEASSWIKANAKSKLSDSQLFVAATSELSAKQYFGEYKYDISVVKSNWAERSNHIWDYAIFPVTGIEPEILTSAYFPPKNTIDTICVYNMPIGIVLERRDTCDLYGRGYLANNEVGTAIQMLERAVELDNTNESAMINLIDANLRINNKAEMKKWIDKYLEISPRSDIGNYFNAIYFNTIGANGDAEKICKEIIATNPRYIMAYLLLSTIYIQEKQYDNAESTVLSLVDYDMYTEEAAKQLVRVYNAQKKDIRDAEIRYYDYASQSYKQRGKKELADKYSQLHEKAVAERNKQ